MSEEKKKKIQGNLDEEKIEYIVRHLSDRMWRIENMYYIVDEDGNKIKFKPNFIQREILQAIFMEDDDYLRHIILKYRQG